MSEVVIGDVRLPDGRMVHAVMRGTPDPSTNGWDQVSIEISWLADGEELTADDYSIEVPHTHRLYGERMLYLHEYVAEMLADVPAEPES